MSTQKKLSWWRRVQDLWFRWADLNQQARWFPWFLGLMTGVDAIVVFLPGDQIAALATLSNPKAWRRSAMAAGIGSALGAFVLYLLVIYFQGHILDLIARWEPGMLEGGNLERARQFFDHWGVFALSLGSVLPLFSWMPVIIAGLAGANPEMVLLHLMIGRIIRFHIVCGAMRFGWGIFASLREEARQDRERALGDLPEELDPRL